MPATNLHPIFQEALRPFMPVALPWASERPIWSGPTPAEVERAGGRYGTLIATPAARGAWMLCHAPGERLHFSTEYSEPGAVIEAHGRRWHVVELALEAA